MRYDPERYGGAILKYDCDQRALPRALSERFRVQCLGEDGIAYLERALSTRPGRLKTAVHRALRMFFSDFDANGLLGMYPMHLLGTSEWRELLGDRTFLRHLDVGAGTGDITQTLAPLAQETVTTETSRFMARNLRRLGFVCIEADVAESGVPSPEYDLVTCLNVIDRCARPESLLIKIAAGLAPGGRLVVATPFPFDPFVYQGPHSLNPKERLAVPRESWERSVTALVTNVLEPLGVELETVSRVPYLCRGDAARPLYVLDDALVVCRKP
jgi:SAM-dependent methyltransferase